jgi:hypothetical protein
MPKCNPTDELAIALGIQYCAAILTAARKAGPKGLPAGPLYAHVMSYMSFRVFQMVLEVLVKAKKIKIEHHVITAL